MSSPAELLAYSARRYIFRPYIFMPWNGQFLVGSGYSDRHFITEVKQNQVAKFLRDSAEVDDMNYKMELEKLEEARQAEVVLRRSLGDFEL